MRIVSMVPSATEIVCALGLEDALVGVTYECDYPPSVRNKPVVVESTLPAGLTPREIHHRVSMAYREGRSYFRVRTDLIEGLRPDWVITQGVCSVCAVSPREMETYTHWHPPFQMLVLEAEDLRGILEDIRRVGEALGRNIEAEQLMDRLQTRMEELHRQVPVVSQRPRVLVLEWLDPPMVAGHWVPEMVTAAGGIPVLAERGKPSLTVAWDDVVAADPDVIVAAPCGYGTDETLAQLRVISPPPAVRNLQAVQQGQVWAVDANAYFSRPGPRVVHGIEVLMDILWGTHTFSDTDAARPLARVTSWT